MLTEDGIPFYIGKTKSPITRYSAHKRTYPNSIFEIIDEVPTAEWKFWERHYISLYKSWGFNLRNKKLYDGVGGDVVSAETRKKISDARKGKQGNFEGKTHTDESKKKMRLSHVGKNISDETRKKISLGELGKKISDETRKKMSDAKKCLPGKKLSDETKKKISLSLLRNKININK